MENKYFKRSKISEARFRHLMKCCNAPPEVGQVRGISGCGLGVEERLVGRPVCQGLVGPLGVVVVDVTGHGSAGFLDVLEGVEPGAFPIAAKPRCCR